MPTKRVTNKKKHSLEVLTRLQDEFGTPKCALHYSNVFELLVATILSAQCTDERVNMVTADLFKKYKTPEDYANADLEEFQQDVKPTGFYRNKGKNIVNMAKRLISEYNGEVPKNMEDLLTLPGVARKTANVVLGVGFGINEGIVVDTHVKRLTHRLGMTKETAPVKVERDLVKLIPQDEWSNFSLLLIQHGRKTCVARKPRCKQCNFVDICPASTGFIKKFYSK